MRPRLRVARPLLIHCLRHVFATLYQLHTERYVYAPYRMFCQSAPRRQLAITLMLPRSRPEFS